MRLKTETAVGLFIVVSVGILLFMSYQIGYFRFDRIRYSTYSVYFNDVSGLTKKSDVKIAGVKVGWVDAVDLINDGQQVKATLMIDKKYVLFSDAHAVVRQEGLLGSKYLELNPGNPLLPQLPAGSMLTRPSTAPVAVDDMMRQFKGIAGNIEKITDSMKGAFAGPEGEAKLKELVSNISVAAEKLASFSSSIDRVVSRNEGTLDSIMNDLRNLIVDLKNEVPRLSGNLQQNFDRIAGSVDKVSNPVHDIAQKISEGRGIIGQLIHDDEAYKDLRYAVSGIKRYLDKIDQLAVVFDVHTESMYGPFQKYCFHDSKAYVNFRIHPTEDYFYLAGLVAAQSGRLVRTEETRQWFNNECHELVPNDLCLSDANKLRYAPLRKQQTRIFDQLLYNIQIGKVFGNFAFRAGLFDSTGGVAFDIDMPLGTPKLRWVSSFEMFDMRGRNRLCDDRPHLKWLNKMFITRNLYFTFGADDFISKHNKNGFVGVGIRFADDDVKYLLSRTNITI